jgi:hypothetical protein
MNDRHPPRIISSLTSILRLPLASAALALSLLACGPETQEAPGTPDDEAVASTSQAAITWSRVYRHDFADMHDVNAFNSTRDINSGLSPTDTANEDLQKPTVASNVGVVSDGAAVDGNALAIHTRRANYETHDGTKWGWANGRMMIEGQSYAPPVRVRTRLRMTASIKTKTAVMWWPSGGGWPWEVDFAETFGGTTLTDYWGGRQHVGQRWHTDLDGDGQARNEIKTDIAMDATKYHVYDLFITPDRMWINIDGVEKFATQADQKLFIPNSAGHFTIGKALTHRRDATDRTNETVFVDWVEIYKPAP